MTALDETQIARICFNAFMGFIEATGKEVDKTWAYLDQHQRDVIVKQVRIIRDNPRRPADELHELFMAELAVSGWTYGKEINKITKQHPQMAAFESLPFESRVQVHLFKEIVAAAT